MGFVVMINEVVRKKTDMCLPAFLQTVTHVYKDIVFPKTQDLRAEPRALCSQGK